MTVETLILLLMSPVLVILMTQNVVYVVQLVATFRERAAEPICVGTPKDLWRLQSRQSLAISIVAPAFNEELSIVQSVRSLLSVNYPHLEVIVVNDGSTDRTLDILTRAFNLVPRRRAILAKLNHQPIRRIYSSVDHPNLVVVDKVNGRKADASNAGIAVAQHPLVCIIDADSLIDEDALLRASQPFLADDGTIIGVGGSIRLTNGCTIAGGRLLQLGMPREWIARFQILEYMRAFMVARVSASRWGMLMLISGAFGLFRREALIEVGGYDHDSRGEDLEVAVALQRKAREMGRRSQILFVADALCWTEAPFNYAGIRNQRQRWAQGGTEVLMKHRRVLFNRRYGRIGMLGLPLVLLETLLVPIAELLGYAFVPLLLWLGMSSGWWLLAMLIVSLLFGTAVTLAALAIEETQMRRHEGIGDCALLVACAFLENLGYRQLNAWFRLRGLKSYLNRETKWLAVERQGLGTGQAAS